jgi:ABC-type lipoprotein export system ATPase subunit
MSPGRHELPEPSGDFDYFDIEPDQVTAAPPAPAVVAAHRNLAPAGVAAESVSYARGGRSILAEVSLGVLPGQSLAVVGPSGSGKSSLLALLAGLEQPDSGRVLRTTATPNGSARRSRQQDSGSDGLILQGYGLVSVLTAAENVEVPLQAGALGRLSRAEIRQRAAAALDSVGLAPVADHLVEELSGGQQQRVAIARALVVDPAVVFADELTAELDHEWKEHVVELVLDVARRGGIAVLATHDLEIAARCDQVLRLVDGRVA